jgi:Leucine-rich repeat (LRR) protein
MKFILSFLFVFSGLISFAQNNEDLRPGEYTSMEDALTNPDGVKILDLHKKKLEEFPVEIFKFKNLEELNLAKNKIKIIPPEIKSLTKIKILNLSRNKLTVFPAELCALTNLDSLIINENEITELPKEIKNLQKLSYFDMWGNYVTVFPDEISQLKNTLKVLDLRVIGINEKGQEEISQLLPYTKIYFSTSCNCK